MILVDTPIWSEAMRRVKGSGNPAVLNSLSELIVHKSAILIGSVRQELLSGIGDANLFARIRERMEIFQDFVPDSDDYILAAELENQCRRSGVKGSNVDMLICAVSIHHGMEIFTLDKDFDHYAKAIPIRLFKV